MDISMDISMVDIHGHIHGYVHGYIQGYIHGYIHGSIHGYIYAYIHGYIPRLSFNHGDASFVLRRKIDFAWAQREGKLLVLALDWKKCFDAINIEALIVGLRRFGVPSKMLNLIEYFYLERRFKVARGRDGSTERKQRSGISQGCPLSPFLFIMLMTVVLQDLLGRSVRNPSSCNRKATSACSCMPMILC